MLVLCLGDEAHLPRDASGSFRTPLGATDVVTGPLALTPVCPQLGCAWGPSVFGAGVPPSSSQVEFARGHRGRFAGALCAQLGCGSGPPRARDPRDAVAFAQAGAELLAQNLPEEEPRPRVPRRPRV